MGPRRRCARRSMGHDAKEIATRKISEKSSHIMQEQRQVAMTRDFHAFMLEVRAVETKLDLEPGLLQFIELSREAAFRAGWNAGQTWQEHHDAEAPTVRVTAPTTVRALVEVGRRGWVQPLAIIEHMGTGELFVDPRFTVSHGPSDRCCIELVVTNDGLVALGPPDRHRLSAEIDGDRLRPLLRLETMTAG